MTTVLVCVGLRVISTRFLPFQNSPTLTLISLGLFSMLLNRCCDNQRSPHPSFQLAWYSIGILELLHNCDACFVESSFDITRECQSYFFIIFSVFECHLLRYSFLGIYSVELPTSSVLCVRCLILRYCFFSSLRNNFQFSQCEVFQEDL